jgi:hypothetical protein
MDLFQNRSAWGGVGAAVSFGLLVAWMVPPTAPQPMAPNWRAHIKAVAPPAPVDFAGYAPSTAAMQAVPVERVAYASDRMSGDDVAIYRGRPSDEAASPVEQLPVVRAASAPVAVNPPMPAYRGGDRWADADDAPSPRDCRDAPSAAAEESCLDHFYARHSEANPPGDDPRPAEQGDAGDD